MQKNIEEILEMKNIKDYIFEATFKGWSEKEMENYVVSSYPVGAMKMCIDKEYRCDIDVTVEEDVIMFDSDDPPIHFSIERVQKRIVCPQGIKDCLMEYFDFDEKEFDII